MKSQHPQFLCIVALCVQLFFSLDEQTEPLFSPLSDIKSGFKTLETSVLLFIIQAPYASVICIAKKLLNQEYTVPIPVELLSIYWRLSSVGSQVSQLLPQRVASQLPSVLRC